MSSFWEETGNTKLLICRFCCQEVLHEECRDLCEPKVRWVPLAHRAPCGAYCSVSSEHGETDLHTPHMGVCPRCGEPDMDLLGIMEKADGSERLLVHRFRRPADFPRGTVSREIAQSDGSWQAAEAFNIDPPATVEAGVRTAGIYFPWAREWVS